MLDIKRCLDGTGVGRVVKCRAGRFQHGDVTAVRCMKQALALPYSFVVAAAPPSPPLKNQVQDVDGEGAADEDGDDDEETKDTPQPAMAPVAEPLETVKPSSSAEKDLEGGEECGANDAAAKDVEEEG